MAPWVDHDRHRRSRPSSEGLAKLWQVIGGDAPVVVRRLGGGLGSATHLLRAGDRRLVLKRYPPGSDVPALEWQGLVFAQSAELKSPAPLALDQEGAWFGSPALLMEAVQGHADVAPKDRKAFVEDVASAMAAIHGADATEASDALLRAHSVDRWEPPKAIPEGLLARPLAGRVIDALRESLADAGSGGIVVNHGDLHPGNVLWHRNRLTAIVDWSGTRLGPRWWEVAYFRIEAAVLTDVRVADSLLREYEKLVGLASPDQSVWDLLCIFNGHQWGHLWLLGYREQGRSDLTPEVMQRRLTRLATRALASL